MKNKYSLIIPICGNFNTEEFDHIYDRSMDGETLLFKSIKKMNFDNIRKIYIGIPYNKDKKWGLSKLIQSQLELLNTEAPIEITKIKNPTKSQPETVAQLIEINKINGSILIKDPDNSFEFSELRENFITIFPLDELDFVSPKDKSYVEIDDNGYVMNIIEKKIISRYFCTGGYFFKDAKLFMKYYNKVSHYENIYMSHLILLMLLNGINFRPVKVDNYVDWGNKTRWEIYKAISSSEPINPLLLNKLINNSL